MVGGVWGVGGGELGENWEVGLCLSSCPLSTIPVKGFFGLPLSIGRGRFSRDMKCEAFEGTKKKRTMVEER